jgi:hypothetical protein
MDCSFPRGATLAVVPRRLRTPIKIVAEHCAVGRETSHAAQAVVVRESGFVEGMEMLYSLTAPHLIGCLQPAPGLKDFAVLEPGPTSHRSGRQALSVGHRQRERGHFQGAIRHMPAADY